MRKSSCSAALILCALLLSGCGVAYDQTKGWANRLSDWAEQEVENLGDSENQHGRPQQTALVTDPAPIAGARSRRMPTQASRPATPDRRHVEKPKPAPTTGLSRIGNKTPPRPRSKPADRSSLHQTAMSEAATRKSMAPQTAARTAEPEAGRKSGVERGYIVHLSSMRSQSSAHRHWQELQRTYPRYLRKLKLSIEKVDLGKRGVFFRVLAGPFPDKRTALQVCAGLQEQRQYCTILGPEAAARG